MADHDDFRENNREAGRHSAADGGHDSAEMMPRPMWYAIIHLGMMSILRAAGYFLTAMIAACALRRSAMRWRRPPASSIHALRYSIFPEENRFVCFANRPLIGEADRRRGRENYAAVFVSATRG